jgi:hypothetical protein
MSSLAIRLLPEPLRTEAFGAIGAGYTAIGTALVNPSRILYMVNTTNALLTFSLDGVNDHFVIPASTSIVLDLTTNKSDQGGVANISAGTTIYVKGAPGSGSVYLTTWYGAFGTV